MADKDSSKPKQIGTYSRLFSLERDYEEYASWFPKQAPVPELLSDSGFIIEADNKKICAGFLIKTNCCTALIEFVAANPKAHRSIRKKSLQKLFAILEEEAKSGCYDMVTIFTSHKLFGDNLAKNFDYLQGEVPHYEYVKILNYGTRISSSGGSN